MMIACISSFEGMMCFCYFIAYLGDYIKVQVVVRENNVDQALKVLKKKLQREGVFREMKMRDHYEKNSERRRREQAEAARRARKLASKAAQREGIKLPRSR